MTGYPEAILRGACKVAISVGLLKARRQFSAKAIRWHNAGIIETAAKGQAYMEHDEEKIDEMVLALLHLTTFTDGPSMRTWKARLGCYGASIQSRLYWRSKKQGQVCDDDGRRTGEIARTVRTVLCSKGLAAFTRSFRKPLFVETPRRPKRYHFRVADNPTEMQNENSVSLRFRLQRKP